MKPARKQIEMLWEEFKMVQDKIMEFDKAVFQIKSWSITLFSVILLFYFDKNHHVLFLYILTAAPVFFWYLDYRYKCFQNIGIIRGRLIQGFFNSPKNKKLFISCDSDYENYNIPDITLEGTYNEEWEKDILNDRKDIRLFFKLHTSGIYILQICLGVALVILKNYKIIN